MDGEQKNYIFVWCENDGDELKKEKQMDAEKERAQRERVLWWLKVVGYGYGILLIGSGIIAHFVGGGEKIFFTFFAPIGIGAGILSLFSVWFGNTALGKRMENWFLRTILRR